MWLFINVKLKMGWDPSIDQGLSCLYWALLRNSYHLKSLPDLFHISLVEGLLQLTEKTGSKNPLVFKGELVSNVPFVPMSPFCFHNLLPLQLLTLPMSKPINFNSLCWKDGGEGVPLFFPPSWDFFIPSAETILNQKLEHPSCRIRWF